MQTDTAIELINSLTLKPGWQVMATKRSGMVAVEVLYQAPDSSEYFAPEYKNPPTTISMNFTIVASKCETKYDLYRSLVEGLSFADQHEQREFLREPDLTAPFHPHQQAGVAAWGASRSYVSIPEPTVSS